MASRRHFLPGSAAVPVQARLRFIFALSFPLSETAPDPRWFASKLYPALRAAKQPAMWGEVYEDQSPDRVGRLR